MIDLITNSSTEIFVHSENSLKVCKELVNEFLQLTGSVNTLTCDDIFDLSLEYTPYIVDNYKAFIKYDFEDNLSEFDERCKELDDFINNKLQVEPGWIDMYDLETKLVIKAKNPSYKKLAELFKKFLYSGEYFEHSNA